MNDHTLGLLENLRGNCHLGKHKHFTAADRFKAYDNWTSVSIMLINFIIAIVHLVTINSEMPHWLIYGISGLSIIAVLLAGFELRSDHAKKFEGHRRIGNDYLFIARECEKNIAFLKDGIKTAVEMGHLIDELNINYNEVNKAAQDYPTSNKDFEIATTIQERKKIEHE